MSLAPKVTVLQFTRGSSLRRREQQKKKKKKEEAEVSTREQRRAISHHCISEYADITVLSFAVWWTPIHIPEPSSLFASWNPRALPPPCHLG